LDSNADDSELRAFLKSVLPEFDTARVYTSDIKKLVSWYKLIRSVAPEVLHESNEEQKESSSEESEEKES
jgi:dTDP-4-dehydrorhamnose reductase